MKNIKFDDFINDIDTVNISKQFANKEKLVDAQREKDLSVVIHSIKKVSNDLSTVIDNKSNIVKVNNFPTKINTPDIEKVVLELKDIKDKFLSKTEPEDIKAHALLSKLISTVEKIKLDIPEQKNYPTEISVNNLKDYENTIQEVVNAVKAIKLDFKPIIDVKPTNVKIEQDFKTLEKKLDLIVGAVKAISIVVPEKDDAEVVKSLSDVKNAINSLTFPTPNYILPFKKSDGSATQALVYEDGSQITRITNSRGDEINSTLVNELMVSEKLRVAGGVFNGTTLDTNFYATVIAANGTATISNSVLDIATTTDSGSSVLVYTKGISRYIGGNMNQLRGLFRSDNIIYTNNTRRFGLTEDSTLANSIYFQIQGSVLSIVAKTSGGSDIKVDNGNFNGDISTYNLTGNFVITEILYTNKTIKFYINNVLVHTLTETTSAICGTRHLRPFVQNTNTGVGSASHIYCQVLSAITWGSNKTQPKYNFQSGTTTGVLLKNGIGLIHGLIISGVTNNSVVTLYDGISTADTVLWSSGTMSNQTVPFNISFNTGIQFVSGLFLTITAANSNCMVMYE